MKIQTCHADVEAVRGRSHRVMLRAEQCNLASAESEVNLLTKMQNAFDESCQNLEIIVQ